MPILKTGMSMGMLHGMFKAGDKLKDALGGSRYRLFFGCTSAGKPVKVYELICKTMGYSLTRVIIWMDI